MHIRILGSAAEGGVPRLGCACRNCAAHRAGARNSKPRSQTQIAFSPIGDIWFLVGASPDLRAQFLATPSFAPAPEAEGHPSIAGVFLPNAEVESVAGLLHLRACRNYFVFATPAVQRLVKSENRIFKVLDHSDSTAQWQPLALRRRIGCHLSDNPGDGPTFFYTAMPLGGEFPEYASEEIRHHGSTEDASIALLLEQEGQKLFIAPRIPGRYGEWLKAAAASDVSLLDAALPLDGPEGLLAQFPTDARGRKVLINLSHTNALLAEGSAEHRAALEAGFEIAYDGMEIQI
jgi:pyrroloquinoline quinone biosynthesis protein B